MNSSTSKLQQAIQLIDEKNAADPNKESYQGRLYAKEILYSERMTKRLNKIVDNPSEELQVAARAQHIMRWSSPRSNYPMDRTGYLKWRKDLYKFHANQISEILKEVGYDESFILKVNRIVGKEKVKLNAGAQIIEDVACLVFLEYYLNDFADKHNEEKIISIIKKTLKKMSEKGKEAALHINYTDKLKPIINKVLS